MTISIVILGATVFGGLAAAQTAQQSMITIQSGGFGCTTVAGSGTFAVQGWSLSAVNPSNVITPVATAAPVHLSGVTFTKAFDECSASLFSLVTTGRILSAVTLTQSDPTGRLKQMTVQLTNVLVSNYQLAGSPASLQPVESVTLSFTQIKITNQLNNTSAGWNLAMNMPM